jgi:hypothetical protein
VSNELSKDFKECNVLIYDVEGNLLVNAEIWEHNIKERYIVVQDWPELAGVSRCKLLILTAPMPYSYLGTIHKRSFEKLIKLYDEHMEENRKEIRYKTDLPGNIENLVYDWTSYPLHKALEVQIVNISRNGIRIQAKDNTLNVGDIFQINIKISGNDKLLMGKVANYRYISQDHCEYGCFLVSKDGEQNE